MRPVVQVVISAVVCAATYAPARADRAATHGVKEGAARQAAAAEGASPGGAVAGGGAGEPASGGAGVSDALRQTSVFGEASRAPWRGSQAVVRTAMSAVTLDPSAELTYNPYVALTWSLRPWWWFDDRLYLRAQLELTHELTEPDDTTYAGEVLLEDVRLVAGGSGLWTIPRAEVLFSADLVLTLPTSKVSRGRTLVLGLGPGVRLSRRFPLLGGLVVGYNLRVTPWLHRFATSERATPLIPGCGTARGGCDPYLGTGRRNPAARLTQMADASVRINAWMGVSLVVGHAIDWLHGIGSPPQEVSLQSVADQDRRYLTFLDLEVSFRPRDVLEIGVGYSALHPQLAPDSRYYVPFFNRYSQLYLDLKLHLEPVVSRIQRKAR